MDQLPENENNSQPNPSIIPLSEQTSSQSTAPATITQPEQISSPPLKRRHRVTIILLNAIPAGALYIFTFGISLLLLVYSSQGSFLQVLTAPLAFFGMFVFIPIALIDVGILFSLKLRGQRIRSFYPTVRQVLLIWSVFLIAFFFYGLDYLITGSTYNSIHNPNQNSVVSLINNCKVSSIEQYSDGNNNYISVIEPNAPPSEGAIITHGNWSVFVSAIKAARQKCPDPSNINYSNQTPVYTWISQEEAITMLQNCEISDVLDTPGFLQTSPYWNYFQAQGIPSSEMPKGPETGYLLDNPGSYVTLTVNNSLEWHIVPTVDQYKKSCPIYDSLALQT